MNQMMNEEQLDQLENFLLAHMEEGCMPLDVAHGFLSAILSGPHMIMPGQWLPRVLGEADFASDDEAQNIMALIMSLYNTTLAELENQEYAPMILSMEEGHEDNPLPLPYGWCEGYIMGWNMQGESSLEDMAGDEAVALHLGPVAAFLMYEEDQLLNPPDEAEHRETVDQLANSAMAIYEWWKPRRDVPVGNA
ncbi:YecA/YgfB family protein [Thiolapillus sp.]